MGFRENRYGPVVMTAVTGFLVRIGVRARRTSRTERTNSATASRINIPPTGSMASGTILTGQTALSPKPARMDTKRSEERRVGKECRYRQQHEEGIEERADKDGR